MIEMGSWESTRGDAGGTDPIGGSLGSRVAVVTGASRGIGAAIARALGREGAFIVGAARTRADLEVALAGLPAALAVPTDVSDPQAVRTLFEAAAQVRGRVDIVVNAAGVLRRAPVEQTTLADWRESLEVNLTAVFLCSRAAVRQMLGQREAPGGVRGHIVQIVSGAGVHGWEGSSAYAASKFGVMGFTETLREEVRGRGIKVTEILPGMVDTDMTAQPEFSGRAKLAPEDVARAVLAAVTASPAAVLQRVDVRHLAPR
ncbi:MAG: SDR family oxidoreductase [Thermoleophilia bacterium]|nr:SDR family oxidoreductase [Thermoleophilia bacterium]